ncbi:acyl-CoA dehydrogenase [Mycobacterium pyrenivorans]|nr:acyl-CoA dehydrogenase [Mycolicibacterium pyrenivorans]
MAEEEIFQLFDAIARDGLPTQIGDHLTNLRWWSQVKNEFPVEACELLFRAQGKSLAQTDCLDRAMLAELSARLSQPADAVILPDLSFGDEPGSSSGQVSGICVGPAASRLVVPVRGPLGEVLIGVVDASHMQISRMNTVDPSVNWNRVCGPLPNDLAEATLEWNLAMGAAHRALATELISLADEEVRICLPANEVEPQVDASELSPTIRETLSQAFADLEAARAVLEASWRYGGRLSGRKAKAMAGRAHHRVCEAVERTTGRDVTRYAKRGFQLNTLCGSYQYLERLLAERQLEERTTVSR